MKVGGQSHTPAALFPGKRPGMHCIGGWVGPTGSLDGCEKSRLPPGFDSSDRQTHSESLYRPTLTMDKVLANIRNQTDPVLNSYSFWLVVFAAVTIYP
jgi:hypothetical protein